MPVSTGAGSVDRTTPYSVNELLALAHYVGFKGRGQASIVAIALSESGGDPNATNVNSDGSVDRGLYQINNKFHPDVSDSCAYDPVCSTRAALAMSNNGKTFAPDPWNPSVDHWTSRLPAVEQAQRSGGWKQFQTQFTSDTGGGTAPTAGNVSGQQQTNLLFQCSSSGHGGINIAGHQIVGNLVQLPDIGCYLEGALMFTVYAVGGLMLLGVGALLIARKNPAKVGAKAVMTAAVPEAAVATSAARPPSLAAQTSAAREARISGGYEAREKVRQSSARAKASKERAQAAEIRERVAASKQRRKEGALSGYAPDTILGYKIPGFEATDPSRMKG